MHSLQLVASPTSQVFRPDARQPSEALVFFLDGQEYGIALNCVQEIRSYQAPARRTSCWVSSTCAAKWCR